MQYFINLLSISRIFFGIFIFTLLMLNTHISFALPLFIIAGFTDYLDGYLARKFNLVSDFGEIMDPISDKILIVIVLFGLSVFYSSYFIAICSSLIISREIWVSALRDFNSRSSNPNATKVIFIAKIKTTIQFIAIIIYLLSATFGNSLIAVIGDIFLFLALSITIYSGIIYTYNTFTK